MIETNSRLSRLYGKLRFPYRDNGLIAVAFFILLLVPLVFSTTLTDSLELPKLAVLLVCVSGGLAVLSRASRLVKYNKMLVVLFALFLAQALLATIFSWDIGISLIGLYTRWTSSLLFYGTWVLTVIIFSQAIETEQQFWFLLKTGIATAFAVALLGIAQSFGFGYYAGLDAPVRSFLPSFLGNPNFSAMYVAALFPIMVIAYQRAVRSPAKLYYLAVIGSSITAIGLFNSRGAIIGAVISGAILVLAGLVQPNYRRLARIALIATGLMLAVSAGLLWANRPQSVKVTASLSSAEISPRLVVWQRSIRFIRQNPLVGVGPGNFYLAYERYLNIGQAVNYENFDDAHNILLQLAATSGLPMVLLYIVIVLAGLWSGWRLWRRTGDPLYPAIIAGIVSWQVSASFNPVAIPCWTLLALLLAGLYRTDLPLDLSIPRAGRYFLRILAGLLVVVAVALVLNDILSFSASTYYYAKQYDKAIRYGKAAVLLNPANNVGMLRWVASRIALGQDPVRTAQLIEQHERIHALSGRSLWTASILYYKLYHQTNDRQYLDKAYSFGDRSLERSPDFGALYFYNAYIHYRNQDYAAAAEYVHQAMAHLPDQLSYWSLLTKIDQETGDRAGTIRALEEAQKLQPASPAYKQVLLNAQAEPDVTKIQIPINFQEPDI